MFIVLLSYKRPIEELDAHLITHRTFLDEGYAQNILVASGPQDPRTGGVLISQLNDRKKLEDFLERDPFKVHGLADYQLIKFLPVKYHPDFESFVE
ncbi:MAG: hypothetical protein KA436_04405 [Oligoflexales bacterium]|nr:hypothetical protein [Oligoflexales bacterium]